MTDGREVGHKVFGALPCMLALLLLAYGGAAQSLAPHQQSALDRILESMPPDTRPLMRQQFTETLAEMDEAEVLDALLQAQAPSADGAMFLALMNAEPTD